MSAQAGIQNLAKKHWIQAFTGMTSKNMDQNISSRPFNAAKFVFLYLTHLVSLVFMAISFGMIIFQAINKFIEDPVNLYSAFYQEDALRFGIAALLVFSPVYYVVSKFIYKALFNGEIKRDSGIRRWLTYLILFVSFLVFAGYLVGFIISFLSGELTIKFLLKVISVIVIAATVFSFYLYDIMRKETEGKKDKVVKIYFYATLAAVVIAFVGAFFVAGNPATTRAKKLDDDILQKFNNIDNCVDQYYREKKVMPQNIDEIKNDCSYLLDESLKDKVTGKAFEYRLKEGKAYELCAEFRSSNKNEQPKPYYSAPDMKSNIHDSGWQCLERKVYYVDTSTEKNIVPEPVLID